MPYLLIVLVIVLLAALKWSPRLAVVVPLAFVIGMVTANLHSLTDVSDAMLSLWRAGADVITRIAR